MKDLFNSTVGFSALSIKDLLEARDQYHYHLMNKKNVVATAIGYYLIRNDEDWPTADNVEPDNSKYKDDQRTLENSGVRPESFPAVLVFVDHWETEEELAKENPVDVVPKMLFLSDGRSVPVCVVYAKREETSDETIDESNINFPRNLIGGGFPLITYTQNAKRIASVGCIVTDGHMYYALTNKHVTGEKGSPIYSKLSGEEIQVGVSADKHLGRILFNKVYEHWPVRETYLNMDIGLIKILDINQWKTDIFNIGTVGRLADLGPASFSLNLIGQPVSGYGSISGEIVGEIKALFYRFKSVGGFEYVSDFLIGSRNNKPLNLHPGDSGTVICYERMEETKAKNGIKTERLAELMPIGVLWGQHILYTNDKKNKSPYALSTCLSTACNLLGVDVVRDWNIDQPYIWGKVGHYTIGNFAIDFIKDRNFRSLMKANVENISFDLNEITPDWDSKDKTIKAKYQKMFSNFCPLADVPDIIWKQSTAEKFGRAGNENLNHYLDADIPCKAFPADATFLEFVTDKSKLTVQNIKKYYDHLDKAKIKLTADPNKGILPLRVWQAFDYMVDALKENQTNIGRFIMGAGTLAHYVGDACQPLHSSYMADGDPKDDKFTTHPASHDTHHRDGTIHYHQGDPITTNQNPGKGVHVAYEDHMIDDNRDELVKGIKRILNAPTHPIMKEPLPAITDGQSAGYAVVELMRKTHLTLPPHTIVEFFKQHKKENKLTALMWQKMHTATIECMARGCRYQAALWEAAWKKGGKKAADIKTDFKSAAFRKKLKSLYENPKEMKSLTLDTIGTQLT